MDGKAGGNCCSGPLTLGVAPGMDVSSEGGG